MKCNDFEKTVLLLAGQRLIDAGTQAEGLRHAESCARCAARLSEERALISGLRAVRAEMANEQVPAHLEAVMLSAFREQAKKPKIIPTAGERFASVSSGGRGRPRSRHWGARWKVAAVAATIVLFTSTGSIVFVSSLFRPEVSTSSIAAVFIPDSPVPIAHNPRDQVPAERTPRRAAKHRAQRTETVTEYFPLREGEDLESIEFAQVVRVELSASALREFGLPMNQTAPDGPVTADVLLGQDGMARAIRFVR